MAFISYASLIDSTRTPEARGLTSLVIETSPMLGMINFATLGRVNFSFATQSLLPQTLNRAYNASFTDQNATSRLVTIRLKPFGSRFRIDELLRNEPGFSASSIFQENIVAAMRSYSLDLKNQIINGDDVANGDEIRGLRAQVANVNSATNPVRNDFAEATNGLKISGATSIQILDSMDALINATQGYPDVIYSNKAVISSLQNAAVTAAANGDFAGIFNMQTITVDGNRFQALMYKNIPIISVERDSQDAEILPFTETEPGSATTGVSMFAVKWGENYSMALQNTPLGARVVPGDPGDTYITENALAIAYKHPKSVSQLQGILAE